MTTDMEAALNGCPFFDDFQPRHLERLMELATEAHFPASQIIFREGDQKGIFYVILSGRVVLEATYHDRMFPVQTLYTGDELGWSGVLNRSMQFQARALDPVHALAFESAKLHRAASAEPYFGSALFRRLFAVATKHLQQTRLRLVESLAASPAAAAAS